MGGSAAGAQRGAAQRSWPQRWQKHKNPEALEVYYKVTVEVKIYVSVSFRALSVVQVTSASNKIDGPPRLQTGSSWVQSKVSPSSQVPKSRPGKGADPRARESHADGSAGLKTGGDVGLPPPRVWGPGPPLWGRPQLPHSNCSVAEPELQLPLSCWPGSPSSVSRGPQRVLLQAHRPGGGCVLPSSPMILPPRLHRLGCFGGLFWGGGVKYLFYFWFW